MDRPKREDYTSLLDYSNACDVFMDYQNAQLILADQKMNEIYTTMDKQLLNIEKLEKLL